jgi:hypothetical protein
MNKYAFALWLSIELIGSSICLLFWNERKEIDIIVSALWIIGLGILGTTINTWFFNEWMNKEIWEWNKTLNIKMIDKTEKKKDDELNAGDLL